MMSILAPLLSGARIQQRSTVDVKICNRAYNVVSVAVIGFNVRENAWMKVGWTNLDYSKCYDFTAYGKGMFYYYSRTGAREWEGGFSSCVDLTNGFNEIQTGGACNPPLLLKQFKGECVSDDGKTIYLDPGR